ncbi:hypothetical protein OIY81_862 [Cryptosporidium canis]|uniref:Uncharacterized protein n=1 Tax=Cryptosporidium canis TaxID=195482 RepID=A0ABQ8P7U2_9CRYT|nr:hypothetical protein OJ252_1756 [Cryptosporidium canis]KAJ1613644.1 hypothetical protein OIY81_862 [Cryptosporidium canis]
MNGNLFRDQHRILSTLGTIGIIVGGIWYITKRNKRYSTRTLNNEEIKTILISFSNEIHPIFMEFSHLISSIKSPDYNLSVNFLNNIESIFFDGGFRERVVNAQKLILDKWKIDEESFENLVYSACKVDEEIQMLKLGINQMYHDSLHGLYPLLPHLGLRTEFIEKYPNNTPDNILKILRALNNEKEKRFKKVFEGISEISEKSTKHPISGKIPTDELYKRLELANNQSEDAIFESIDQKMSFSHAIALYSREEEFVREKKKIENEHSDNILNIIVNYKRLM